MPQTEGKACPHAGLAQDLSSLAYNNEQHGSKGPNDGPEGVQTLHWYRVSVFHLFFAPPKSFLCRLDQTKSLQSISTPQQTFLPRFETLTMQIGLEKYKKQFMEALWSGGGKFLFSNFSPKPRWICKKTWNHNSSLVLLGK